MQNFPKPTKLKIVLLGNRSVGKSSIIRRFVLDDFPNSIQPTVGVDYMSKTITFQGKEYRLELWDTAGQEKYRSMVKGYLKGAHACLYVYDCKNVNSYMDLLEWVNLFQTANPENHTSFIACNKWDIHNENMKQELEKAKKMLQQKDQMLVGIDEQTCSAKTGDSINQIFMKIVGNVVRKGLIGEAKTKTIIGKSVDSYLAVRCCEN